MPLNRIMPKLPQRAVQTYRLRAPVKTHYRQATCAEVSCPNHERGFKIIVDPESGMGRRQAYLIKESRRRYLITRRADGMLDYNFPAGQQCFTRHRVALDREPICIIQRGDWRTPGRLREPRVMSGRDWLDSFGHHQLKLADAAERG